MDAEIREPKAWTRRSPHWCRKIAAGIWGPQKLRSNKQIRPKEIRVNERIRISEVRLVDQHGAQLGVVPTYEAKRIAADAGLDLVEVAPTARPPVCRIMDFGKYKYEQAKKAKESKKKQHTVNLKEMRFRPKIEEHDFQFKTRHVREFLTQGNKVRCFVLFRGRYGLTWNESIWSRSSERFYRARLPETIKSSSRWWKSLRLVFQRSTPMPRNSRKFSWNYAKMPLKPCLKGEN